MNGWDATISQSADGKMGLMEIPFSTDAVAMLHNTQKDETTAKRVSECSGVSHGKMRMMLTTSKGALRNNPEQGIGG